jgi:hypothetical protein
MPQFFEVFLAMFSYIHSATYFGLTTYSNSYYSTPNIHTTMLYCGTPELLGVSDMHLCLVLIRRGVNNRHLRNPSPPGAIACHMSP